MGIDYLQEPKNNIKSGPTFRATPDDA